MGAWTKNKVESSQINGGQEYTISSNPSLEQLNAITNNSFYAVDKADEALEKANSAFENNGTVVSVGGSPVANLSFSSNPQEQIDSKANAIDLSTTNSNISYLTENKANKDLSNVLYPQLTPDGLIHTASGYITYMSTDGNTWYIIYPTGRKECARKTGSFKNDIVEFTFPFTFGMIPTVTTGGGKSTYESAAVNIREITTSKVVLVSSGSYDYCWIKAEGV